jgi:hypothetical protein
MPILNSVKFKKMEQLPAFIATKRDLANLPDDTRLLYVVLPPNEGGNEGGEVLAIAEHAEAPRAAPTKSSAKKRTGRAKRPRSTPASSREGSKSKRKRSPLKLHEHCFSTTSKKRCGYPHQLRKLSLAELLEILENSPEDHKAELVCKKHGKGEITLSDPYLQDSIVFLQQQVPPRDGDEEDASPEEDDEDNEMLQQLEQEILDVEEEDEEDAPNAVVAADPVVVAEPPAEPLREQTWEENLSEMVSGIKAGAFVFGQREDGSTAMPEINSGDNTQKMFLVSWNYHRNCGILYMVQKQAFWYVTLDPDTQEMKETPKLIENAGDLEVLKQYMNVPNAL